MRPEGEPRASRTHQFGDAATVNTLITELKLVLKAEGSSIPSMPGAIQPPDIHRRRPPPASNELARSGPQPRAAGRHVWAHDVATDPVGRDTAVTSERTARATSCAPPAARHSCIAGIRWASIVSFCAKLLRPSTNRTLSREVSPKVALVRLLLIGSPRPYCYGPKFTFTTCEFLVCALGY